MKTRSSAGVGQKIDLNFDLNTLKITDDGDYGDNTSVTSNEIMNKIKPGVANTVEPNEAISAVKADVRTNQLQAMLNSFKSE